jgi:hypothetical protein
MVVTVIDPVTGQPLNGLEDNISCYIKNPNGNFLINGSNPESISDGMYKLEFTMPIYIGTYSAWAILDFEEKEYYGTCIFEGRWNPYTNLTEAKYKIGDAVKLINMESRDKTSQAISHSGDTTQDLEQLSVDTSKVGFWGRLQEEAISTFFSWIFMILLMLGVMLVSSWFYSKKKSKEIAEDVSNLPKALITRLRK